MLGLLLLLADRTAKLDRDITKIRPRDAALIGFAQALALIPGVSRSGATISAGLLRGFDRVAAARYSFLLSIPAVGGAGVLELIKERHALGQLGWTPITVAIVVAFISGYASIWFLIRYLRTHTTHVFIYYRYLLGAAMIAMLVTGYLKS